MSYIRLIKLNNYHEIILMVEARLFLCNMCQEKQKFSHDDVLSLLLLHFDIFVFWD